jgi:hypothetical protein
MNSILARVIHLIDKQPHWSRAGIAYDGNLARYAAHDVSS